MPVSLADILPGDVIEKLREYVSISSEVVRKFKKAVELLNKYQVGDARAVFAELVKLEDKGEKLRGELEYSISSLRLEASFMSELLSFVSSVDRISDHVKEVSKELRILPFLEIPQELRNGLLELCETVAEAVETYNEAFEAVVSGDYNKALELVGKTLELEEKADDLEVRNRGLILEAGDRFKPLTMAIIVHNLNRALEDTADICAVSANNLRILIMTRLL
ncbi:DUF47 domain-containing protein [Desulfurococcus mucosus]|uniref:PhoU family protein n=1 Tax=Desulfurococcus mucosus (strain ATCC 35584 / DSM 2162 / JCM 9187 / O7/1) TaxID=765177 RepID=E8R868_DESM0|nr:DUF47 family protein [Desulfurococcus mucosus]ADV64694.1 PhoU family protein [Desulfurococcus mucosus DSM 2162]